MFKINPQKKGVSSRRQQCILCVILENPNNTEKTYLKLHLLQLKKLCCLCNSCENILSKDFFFVKNYFRVVVTRQLRGVGGGNKKLLRSFLIYGAVTK